MTRANRTVNHGRTYGSFIICSARNAQNFNNQKDQSVYEEVAKENLFSSKYQNVHTALYNQRPC